ncbi:MAG TPA: glycosyltransferase family 4 protein [Gemmatimonadaceae bacterium]|nr:glycosyltransferase family 4 protein [Gemmatimonadaceae bacterium]
MRILHVDTERGWRGGERQALWLAAELRRRGHLSIVAARPGEPLAQRAVEAGLEVAPCTPRFEADPRAAMRLRRLIKNRRIELVHSHTAHALGLASLATIASGVPLVAARRVDFHLRDNFGTRWKYGRAAAVIAISRAVADILASDGIGRAKIAVVPDGTDVQRRIVPATPATLLALGVRQGAPLVVQVAQLVPHKDPLNFVRAIATARERVPGIQALLVGEGELRISVENTVRALGLTGALHVVGYRNDADALLAAADVVVLSSREEGMGSVLLDALLLGKPIAATRAGGIPDVVEPDINGLLAPVEDSRALGDNISRLLTDHELAERMSAAARGRSTNFSVERMTERTLAVYERVIARAPLEGRDETNRLTDAATRTSSASSIRAP